MQMAVSPDRRNKTSKMMLKYILNWIIRYPNLDIWIVIYIFVIYICDAYYFISDEDGVLLSAMPMASALLNEECVFFMCFCKLNILDVIYSQPNTSQAKVTPSCTASACSFNLSLVENFWPHSWHVKVTPWCILCSCLLSPPAEMRVNSHLAQGNVISSCFALLCAFKKLNWTVAKSHWSHETVFSECRLFLCLDTSPLDGELYLHKSQENCLTPWEYLCFFISYRA